MLKNKKAISAVVATVLIILITVAAVTIIWTAIIPMITNQISGGTVCLDATSQVTLGQGYTCLLETTGGNLDNLSVQIIRGPKDFGYGGVVLSFDKDGTTVSHELTAASTLTANGGKVYYLLGNEVASGFNYTEGMKLEVKPIVQTGNTRETCSRSSEVILRKC